MVELIVPAKVEKLDEVILFINTNIEDICKNSVERATIDIAVEEVFVNIANYAYEKDTEGTAIIRVVVCEEKKEILLQFIDQGIPYNPLEQEAPDITLDLNERQIGGLGIFIVKESMDEVMYEYRDNSNILTMIKRIHS